MKEKAESLAAEFTEKNVPEDALDDLVHDNAQEDSLDDLNDEENEDAQEEIIEGSEKNASDINNGGFEEQIEYLLEAGVTEDEIRNAANLPTE